MPEPKYYLEYTATGNTTLNIENSINLDKSTKQVGFANITATKLAVGGGNIDTYQILSVKGSTNAAGNYGLYQVNSSGAFVASIANDGNMNVAGNTTSSKFISNAASGPPISSTSTDKCTNINADLLDGMHLADVNGVSGGPSFNQIPWIRGDGVLEIGKYIDFHESSYSSIDYDVRFNASSGALTMGSATLTAGNFILSSDRKLKTNISPLNKDISDIEFVEFEMLSKLGIKRYGVIAQDIENIAPELVYVDPDGNKTVAYIDLLIIKVANLEKKIKSLENDSFISGSECSNIWQIDLSWNISTDAVSYEIWRSSDINGTYYLVGQSDTNKYNDITLHNKKTYYYKILSYDIEGYKSMLSSASKGIVVDGII